MIYLIKSGNYCKIGYSMNKKTFFSRMRTYLTHNPSYQILDIRKGTKKTEENIHNMIPSKLHHYGEWFVWSKKIAKIWLHFYKLQIKGSLEDYFKDRNKRINKVIVKEYRNTPYLNFIRYFSQEPNLDLSEPEKRYLESTIKY